MAKARVMIAEDDADMRDLLQEVLEEADYEAIVAIDGRIAMDRVERELEMIDLLVTDVRMPKVTGQELLAVMREKRPEAPVIVITAFGTVEEAVGMLNAGAFRYLTKPLMIGELLQTVESALEHSAHQREQARMRREMPVRPERVIDDCSADFSHNNVPICRKFIQE